MQNFTDVTVERCYQIPGDENDEYVNDIGKFMAEIYKERNFSKAVTDILLSFTDFDKSKRNNVNYKTNYVLELLKTIINKPKDMSEKRYNEIKENIFSPGKDTLIKWFNGDFPNHGNDGRKRIFALCFALKMDNDQAVKFFNKAYFDRYVTRQPPDFIYDYCLSNKKSYIKACEMITDFWRLANNIEEKRKSDLESVFTNTLLTQAREKITEEQLLEYILSILPTFKKNYMTVIEKSAELFKSAKKQLAKTIDCQESQVGYNTMLNNFIVSESLRADKSLKNISDFTNLDYVKNIVKKSLPSETVLGDVERDKPIQKLNYFALRNTFVLLHFYTYWTDILNNHYNDYIENSEYYKEEYLNSINMQLNDGSMGMLYPCNPYDMMFILSSSVASIGGDPIVAFSDILSNIFEGKLIEWE